MAHEIEGNKAFFAKNPAWHGLGKVFENAPNIDEAIAVAYPHNLFKMDCEYSMKTDDGEVFRQLSETTKIIVRDDGKELGSVGPDFELVQPLEIANHFRPLERLGVKMEAGGSLRDGRQMWLLGSVPGALRDVLKNDAVKGYFLMYTGFEGSLRVGGTFTGTRVVCANTLAMSLGEQANEKSGFKFKHTRNVRFKLDNAMATVQGAVKQFNGACDAFEALGKRHVTRDVQEDYITRVLLTDAEIAKPDDVSPRKANIVQHVIELLDTQAGLELVPAARGTAWQAYNAVTQYLTHDYGRSEESRVYEQWFGQNVALNKSALNLALAM